MCLHGLGPVAVLFECNLYCYMLVCVLLNTMNFGKTLFLDMGVATILYRISILYQSGLLKKYVHSERGEGLPRKVYETYK